MEPNEAQWSPLELDAKSDCSIKYVGCSVAQLVVRWLAGPRSILGSAHHGGSDHWADSCEDMEMGHSECLWMNELYMNVSIV
jgi:hypothetical protein